MIESLRPGSCISQDVSLLPSFATVEHMFSSPAQPSFFPDFEVPKALPALKELTRIARCIYPHWKDRRLERKGKTIFPGLNVSTVGSVKDMQADHPQYDETNDGDPYVCFRRRDIRQTRKARRTDNFSVERMQKLQFELRSAYSLVQMVQRREAEKAALYKIDKEVWEAKWKLFETKKRWPSLGMTREEEELITGRQSNQPSMGMGTINAAMLGGREALAAQRDNVPSIRKRIPDKDRDDRDKRDRGGMDPSRMAERALGLGSNGRSYAPDVLKERILALRQKLEEQLAERKAADADWDDATSVSRDSCCSICHQLISLRTLINLCPHPMELMPSVLLPCSILPTCTKRGSPRNELLTLQLSVYVEEEGASYDSTADSRDFRTLALSVTTNHRLRPPISTDSSPTRSVRNQACVDRDRSMRWKTRWTWTSRRLTARRPPNVASSTRHGGMMWTLVEP